MRNNKHISLLLLALSISILLISCVQADGTLAFYKPDRTKAQDVSCVLTNGATITCNLQCPATIAACCNQEGQYYLNWTNKEGLGEPEKDCRPATFCSSSDVNTTIANAFSVNWDASSTYCTSTCTTKVVGWNVGNGNIDTTTCCGDDAGEYYQSPANLRSCDGSEACCDNAGNYSRNGVCVDSCPNVTTVYFRDMAKNMTFVGNGVNVSDYVEMRAELPGVDDGREINFTLYGYKAGSKCIQNSSKAWASNKNATAVVQVRGLCRDGSAYSSINFNATFQDDWSSTNVSALLLVTQPEANEPPHAIIMQPNNGDVIAIPLGFSSVNVNFVSGSYDIDDPISQQWLFGDGTTSNQPNPNKVYNTPGPKIVTLTVTDRRGLTSQAKIGILIDNLTQNDQPLAIITSPKEGQTTTGLLVSFDASASTDDIKNDRSPACVSSTGKCWKDLIFSWSFDDGYVYTAKGSAGGAAFTRLFSSAGPHKVTLTVNDSDPIGTAEVNFFIAGCQINLGGDYEFVPFGICSPTALHYYCVNASSIHFPGYYDTMAEHCEGFDGTNLTLDDCCPRGYYCKNAGPPIAGGGCVLRPNDCITLSKTDCPKFGCVWIDDTTGCMDPANVSSCTDYGSQESCKNDILGLGRPGGRGLGTDMCGKTIGNYVIPASSCNCTWDAGTGCRLYYEANSTLGGALFISCKKRYINPGACDLNGKQTLRWVAECIGSAVDCASPEAAVQCSGGQRDVKCPVTVSQLNFFTWLNIPFVLILIAFYYYLREKRLRR